MGGRGARVPPRIAWAVELLDVGPDDHILEFGCGPGVAVSLVCGRLDRGRITAIDRSATAIRRTLARNAACVDGGRAVLEQVELARFGGGPGEFDKAFAVNVNVFWTSEARAECEVLARVLRPGGVVRLVYGGPPPGEGTLGRDVGPDVAARLRRHGFSTEVTADAAAAALCVTGRRSP